MTDNKPGTVKKTGIFGTIGKELVEIAKTEQQMRQEVLKDAVYPSNYYFIVPFVCITLFSYFIFYNSYIKSLRNGGITNKKYSNECHNEAISYCRGGYIRSITSRNNRSRCISDYKINNCQYIETKSKTLLYFVYWLLPMILAAIVGGLVFRMKFCSLSPKVCLAQSLYNSTHYY